MRLHLLVPKMKSPQLSSLRPARLRLLSPLTILQPLSHRPTVRRLLYRKPIIQRSLALM